MTSVVPKQDHDQLVSREIKRCRTQSTVTQKIPTLVRNIEECSEEIKSKMVKVYLLETVSGLVFEGDVKIRAKLLLLLII